MGWGGGKAHLLPCSSSSDPTHSVEPFKDLDNRKQIQPFNGDHDGEMQGLVLCPAWIDRLVYESNVSPTAVGDTILPTRRPGG